MTRNIICFRPSQQLKATLKDYQLQQGIPTVTETIHKYIEHLELELSLATADLKTLKEYKLGRDTEAANKQTRQCLYWKNETVTIAQCDECRTKRKIPQCPIAGKEAKH